MILARSFIQIQAWWWLVPRRGWSGGWATWRRPDCACSFSSSSLHTQNNRPAWQASRHDEDPVAPSAWSPRSTWSSPSCWPPPSPPGTASRSLKVELEIPATRTLIWNWNNIWRDEMFISLIKLTVRVLVLPRMEGRHLFCKLKYLSLSWAKNWVTMIKTSDPYQIPLLDQSPTRKTNMRNIIDGSLEGCWHSCLSPKNI